MSIANTLALMNRLDEAQAVLDSLESKFQYIEDGPYESDFYIINFDIANRRGDKDATDWLYNAYISTKQLYSPASQYWINDIRQGLSDLEIRKAYESEALSGHRKTYLLVLLAIVLTIMLILSAVALVGYRRKSHDLKALKKAKENADIKMESEAMASSKTLMAQGEQIASIELQNQRLRSLIKRLIDEVDATSGPSSRIGRKTHRILNELDTDERGLKGKPGMLESVNQRFFDTLHRRHPNLTNAEKDICAYALMNLSAKEIAEITNRSEKTVRVIRYNLRKKIGIPANVPIETYMRELSASVNLP